MPAFLFFDFQLEGDANKTLAVALTALVKGLLSLVDAHCAKVRIVPVLLYSLSGSCPMTMIVHDVLVFAVMLQQPWRLSTGFSH